MLRYDPAQRPTVTVAMKHPWLNMATSSSKLERVLAMPGAVRSFASSSGLRRLALATAARELDDCELHYVRCLFQSLELECDGALTRPALERAAWMTGTAGAVAAELSRAFDNVDTDGSGTIDWSELVAVALSTSDRVRKETFSEVNLGKLGEKAEVAEESGSVRSGQTGMPLVREDACFRSFDLLSQGSGAVSGVSLGRLFAPTEVAGWLARNGGVGGGTGGMDAACIETPRVAELDQLVREAETSGSVDSSAYARMLVSAYG